MPNDDQIRIGAQVDVSQIQAGMEEGTEAVSEATSAWTAALGRFGQFSSDVMQEFREGLAQGMAQGEAFAATQAKLAALADADAAAITRETQATQNLISSRLAAGAEFRILEGNLTGTIRASEAFASSILGLGPIIQAAFPLFGAVAFGQILYEIGAGAYNFGEEIGRISDELNEGFGEALIDKITGVASAFDDANAAAAKYQQQAQRIAASNQTLYESYVRVTQGEVAADRLRGSVAIGQDRGLQPQIRALAQEVQQLEARAKETTTVSDPQTGLSNTYATRGAKEAQAQLTEKRAQLNALQQEDSHYQLESLSAQTAADKATEQEAQRHAREVERIAEEAARKQQQLANLGIGAGGEQRRAANSARLYDEMERQNSEAVARMSEDWQKGFEKDTAAAEKAFREQLEIAKAVSEEEVKAAQDAFTERTKDIDQARSQGQINPMQRAQLVMQAANAEYEVKAEALQKMTALDAQDPTNNSVKVQQDLLKIQELQRAHENQMLDITRQADQQQQQADAQRFAALDSAFNNSLTGWLQGTQRFSQAMQHAWDSIGLTVTENLLKMTEEQLQHELTARVVHQATNQMNVTSDTTAAAQSETINATSALSQAVHFAGVAAIKAYSAFADIPVVGPELGAAAAAATFAGAMAFEAFEQGGIVGGDIGSAVPIMAHAGERVLTVQQTQQFEKAMSSGSPQSGQPRAGINFHYSPQISGIDGASVAGMARNHGQTFMREATRQLRRMNLTN